MVIGMTIHQLAVGGQVLEKASSTCVCFLKLNKSNSSLEDIVPFSLGWGRGGGGGATVRHQNQIPGDRSRKEKAFITSGLKEQTETSIHIFSCF